MKSKKIFLTEENLILALKSQEPIGIQALTDMYSASLGGVISRILQDSELSKDVLQEVMLRIWCTAHNYESCKGRLFTWMINIARNYTIDVLRSKRYRNIKKNMNIDDYHQLVNSQLKFIYNPDTVLVRELVRKLKPDFNILLEMVYYKGYTHVEIADELNLPLGTVKTRIRMAIMELRTQFN